MFQIQPYINKSGKNKGLENLRYFNVYGVDGELLAEKVSHKRALTLYYSVTQAYYHDFSTISTCNRDDESVNSLAKRGVESGQSDGSNGVLRNDSAESQAVSLDNQQERGADPDGANLNGSHWTDASRGESGEGQLDATDFRSFILGSNDVLKDGIRQQHELVVRMHGIANFALDVAERYAGHLTVGDVLGTNGSFEGQIESKRTPSLEPQTIDVEPVDDDNPF